MEKQSPSRTLLVCLLFCLAIALLALIFPFIVDGAAESPYAGLVALAISWWVVAPLALIGAAISGIIMLVRHWRKRPPNPRVVVFGVVAIGIVALVLVFVIPAARQPGLVEDYRATSAQIEELQAETATFTAETPIYVGLACLQYPEGTRHPRAAGTHHRTRRGARVTGRQDGRARSAWREARLLDYVLAANRMLGR